MNVKSAVDVLLVEDNPQDAELTVRVFKKQNLANRIHTVEDGAEALDFLFCRGEYVSRNGAENPKVVLLDLKLPKVSGLEVLHAMKNNKETRDIPVVIVTSSREDPDIAEAYSLGANSYVVKPVDFKSFADAMSKVGYYWLLVNQGLS